MSCYSYTKNGINLYTSIVGIYKKLNICYAAFTLKIVLDKVPYY